MKKPKLEIQKDDPMTLLIIQRQERVERCGKAIEEACKKERVTLAVTSLNLIEGKIQPQIQLMPID